MSKLASALALAEQGFRIFPLSPRSKKPPRDFAWKEEATTDPDQIRAWWKTDPNFNVGVATGGGTIVVDADTKEGAPGLASLEMLEIACGMPKSFRVQTPSGGMHVYLRVDQTHRNRVHSIPDYPGIDIRSDNGYVVGPGSVVDGKPYVAIPGAIEPAGAEVEAALLANAPTHTVADSKAPAVELDLPAHIDLAKEYLVNRAPEAVEGAGGNETTYTVAARCREYGLTQEATLEIMLEHWNETKAFPAWLPAELATVVANAYRYATGSWGGGMAVAEFDVVDLGEDVGVPAERRASKWSFETVGDLRQYPPVKWLVKDWIPENSTGIIYGKWGSGKSFLMFDLAFHLAYGFKTWHGAELPGDPKRVLVLAREGHQGFTSRADAFKRFRQIDADQDRLVFMRSPIDFLRADEFKSFAVALKSQPKFDLIIIDTVARAIAGRDMSKPEEITTFTERCALLTKATGATTIGVHHQNKGGSIFGSVFFEANSDFVYRVEKTGGEDTPLKQGTVTCTKMKDGEDGWKKFLRYEKILLSEEPDGGSSLVVAEISGTAGTSQLAEALGVIREAYSAAAGGSGLSKHPRAKDANRYAPDHIANALRISVDAAVALMNELINKRFVSEQQNSKTKSKFIAPTTAAVDFDQVNLCEDAAETGAEMAETQENEAA